MGVPDRVLLKPGKLTPPGQLAGAYDALSRYAEAIRARQHEIALAPGFVIPRFYQAQSYLLWRADTASARLALQGGARRRVLDLLTRASLPFDGEGRALWLRVVPAEVLAAKDEEQANSAHRSF